MSQAIFIQYLIHVYRRGMVGSTVKQHRGADRKAPQNVKNLHFKV